MLPDPVSARATPHMSSAAKSATMSRPALEGFLAPTPQQRLSPFDGRRIDHPSIEQKRAPPFERLGLCRIDDALRRRHIQLIDAKHFVRNANLLRMHATLPHVPQLPGLLRLAPKAIEIRDIRVRAVIGKPPGFRASES